MKKIIINNLLILGSLLFFLAVSAFTIIPEEKILTNTGDCMTCPSQNTCAPAIYCGFSECDPDLGEWCELYGVLCGSDPECRTEVEEG